MPHPFGGNPTEEALSGQFVFVPDIREFLEKPTRLYKVSLFLGNKFDQKQIFAIFGRLFFKQLNQVKVVCFYKLIGITKISERL